MKKISIFFLAVICLFLFSNAFASPQYAIVIDAGSSGSRLHLFTYENDKQPSSHLPSITEVFYEANKIGLSAFSDHPDDAGASLKKILDDGQAKLTEMNIPPEQVPVDVFATAGMRLLPKKQQKLIYASVKDYIKKNYLFNIKTVEAKTITGRTEALYGWLDVNYLAQNFQPQSVQTLGSIDMGGASTQIAFALPDADATATAQQQKDKKKDVISLYISDRHYQIFAHSFLGLGIDKARSSLNENKDSCYPKNYNNGNFDFATCTSAFNQILDQYQINTILAQDIPKDVKFLAYSGAFYTYHFFNADDSPQPKIALENQLSSVCYQPWETLKKLYPTVAEKYLSDYCANGVYIDSLFYNQVHGYGITDEQLTITDNINHQSIDWTLGALLYHLLPSHLDHFDN